MTGRADGRARQARRRFTPSYLDRETRREDNIKTMKTKTKTGAIKALALGGLAFAFALAIALGLGGAGGGAAIAAEPLRDASASPKYYFALDARTPDGQDIRICLSLQRDTDDSNSDVGEWGIVATDRSNCRDEEPEPTPTPTPTPVAAQEQRLGIEHLGCVRHYTGGDIGGSHKTTIGQPYMACDWRWVVLDDTD